MMLDSIHENKNFLLKKNKILEEKKALRIKL